MEAASTRAVHFEMCGNDYLSARKRLAAGSGQCDLTGLDAALQTCSTNTERAMQRINSSAPAAAKKVVSNLYYPGYDADNTLARCTDASGQRVNIQKVLLSYMARSNWRVCSLAKQYGFGCADSFAEFMGSDADTNSDGVADSDALRFDPSETEAAYVDRISGRLRATVVDANHKGTGGPAGATADFIFTDDIHPTAFGPQISTGTGQGPADFTDAQIVNGKNPQWNSYGHERMGWALWRAGAP
jgi:hypothetical protein